jgi:hypothetical protein
MRTKIILGGLFGTVCLIACASKKSNGPDDNADGVDVAASTAQVSRFEEMEASPIATTDPLQAASALAGAQWWPAGCATRSRDASDPATVHIHLDDCTGPFGLRHHTGDVTVVFSKNADGTLHAHATSANMTVNGHPVSYERDKDIAISGTTRTVTSTGSWTRENADGETVTFDAKLSIVVDLGARCRTTNGTSVKTKINGREVDSTITDYKVCRGPDGAESCPSGTITHTHVTTGKTITVEFDGSATAKVTGPRGATALVPLVCGASSSS